MGTTSFGLMWMTSSEFVRGNRLSTYGTLSTAFCKDLALSQVRLPDTYVLHQHGLSGLVFNLIFRQIPSPYLSRNWMTSWHFCSFGDLNSQQTCMIFKFFLGNCCMFAEWLDLGDFSSPECLTRCAAACSKARLFLLTTTSSLISNGGRIISHPGMECPFCSSRISRYYAL